MAEAITAYVKKGCKTCQRVLDFMRSRGMAFETVDLVQEPLDRERLAEIVRMLDIPPRELLRPLDRRYRELNLKERKAELSDEEILDLMVRSPGLIKRPILLRGERAVLGVKPEEAERLRT